MLICRKVEGVHGQKKFRTPAFDVHAPMSSVMKTNSKAAILERKRRDFIKAALYAIRPTKK